MMLPNKSLNEPSEISLSVPLIRRYYNNIYRYEMVPTNGEYQTFGIASWKMALSWFNNKARVTLYCRRKSSRDTLFAVYTVNLISTGNLSTRYVQIYGSGTFMGNGFSTFYGSVLETSATLDLKADSRLSQYTNECSENRFLQMRIKYLEPEADDMSVKIYEDTFSSVDKGQFFSESSSYPWDCVILFDNKKVHVNKTLLSMHSDYWKKVFVKHKDPKEFSLTDVDYKEFIELLSVIYPTAHPVTVKNVETLSKLAHEFKMSELLKRCDVFLMANSTTFGRSKLLLLAQNYNLERLQTQCINEFKSLEDIKAIKRESEYACLDYRTKRMLLDKILGIISSSVPEISHASSDLAINEHRAAKILCKLSSLTSCPPDIVLVVGNNQIPVHKQFLSVFSDFFNKMFQSELKESRESEILLEDVRYEEVLELLSIVYPSVEYFINETNIATIVKLADRFMMPVVLERCKQKLKSSNEIKGSLKLWLAQQYSSLAELQEEFARKCNSIEDVQKLKTEPEFDLLDNKMRALILESITK